MTEAAAEHVRPEQLFALLWANKDNRPPAEGEGADAELTRMFNDMDDRFQRSLAPEHRLGSETAERLWEHAVVCDQCRMLLLEDGPGSRPPKTEAEVQQEVSDKEAKRKQKVIRFWIDLVVGIGAFMGAFTTARIIESKKPKETAEEVLRSVNDAQIDPLWYLFAVLILVASWFLAEAYSIARDLWIDFRAWKSAVPVIGKKWAARDQRNRPGPKG
jgi:hypothetical protein